MDVVIKPNIIRAVSPAFLIFVLLFGLLFLFRGNNFFFIFDSFLILLSIIFLIFRFGNSKNSEYEIFNHHISKNKNFFNKRIFYIPVNEITNISYRVNWFWDRLLKTGSVKIYTLGVNTYDISLPYISDPVKIYDKLNSILKVNDSIKINSSGEPISETSNDLLISRIKPNVFVGVFYNNLPLIILFIIFFLAMGPYLFFFNLWTSIIILVLIVSEVYFLRTMLKKRYYDFYKDKLEYYEGFFTLNKATIPNERITNIAVTQTVMENFFGVSTIQVQTAGSKSSNVRMPYVVDARDIVQHLRGELKKNGRN